MEPLMKWAGGKRKLLPAIKGVIDLEELNGHTLYEPFVGGGALFLDLMHNSVVINDLNSELVNVYNQIKDNPDELIRLLEIHRDNNCHDYYYQIRNIDRMIQFNGMNLIEKAARSIYLNRVCYNGLYRVNSKGQFNVPYGRYVHPEIVFENKIREISAYLNNNNVVITNLDFEAAVANAVEGDVVYFDPPYDYDGGGFTSYTANGFNQDSLRRLKRVCDDLIERGCRVIISNNDTTFVNELFSNDQRYVIDHVLASRMINCNGQRRDPVMEVIIHG